MKEHRRDLVTGTVLLVLAVIYLGLTKGIRAFTGDGATPITAKTMPQIWGVIMLLCAAGLIVRSLIRQKKQGKSSCGAGCAHCAMHGQCHKD